MLMSEGRFPIPGNSPVKCLPSRSSGPRACGVTAFRRGCAAAPSRSPEARGGLPWPGIAAPSRSAGALSAAGRSGPRDRIRPARRPGCGTRAAAPGAARSRPGDTRGDLAGRSAEHLSHPVTPHRTFASVPLVSLHRACPNPGGGHLPGGPFPSASSCLCHPVSALRRQQQPLFWGRFLVPRVSEVPRAEWGASPCGTMWSLRLCCSSRPSLASTTPSWEEGRRHQRTSSWQAAA